MVAEPLSVHRDEGHVVLERQLHGELDLLDDGDLCAVGRVKGEGSLAIDRATSEVHQPWHAETAELRPRHAARIIDPRRLLRADEVDRFVRFGNAHGPRSCSANSADLLRGRRVDGMWGARVAH